jgi:hypothetical protein
MRQSAVALVLSDGLATFITPVQRPGKLCINLIVHNSASDRSRTADLNDLLGLETTSITTVALCVGA